MIVLEWPILLVQCEGGSVLTFGSRWELPAIMALLRALWPPVRLPRAPGRAPPALAGPAGRPRRSAPRWS